MLRRLITLAIPAVLAVCVLLVAASRMSDWLLTRSGTTIHIPNARPSPLACLFLAPPITSETAAACVAFQHLGTDLGFPSTDIYYVAGLNRGIWNVHVLSPCCPGGWEVTLAANTGVVIDRRFNR